MIKKISGSESLLVHDLINEHKTVEEIKNALKDNGFKKSVYDQLRADGSVRQWRYEAKDQITKKLYTDNSFTLTLCIWKFCTLDDKKFTSGLSLENDGVVVARKPLFHKTRSLFESYELALKSLDTDFQKVIDDMINTSRESISSSIEILNRAGLM